MPAAQRRRRRLSVRPHLSHSRLSIHKPQFNKDCGAGEAGKEGPGPAGLCEAPGSAPGGGEAGQPAARSTGGTPRVDSSPFARKFAALPPQLRVLPAPGVSGSRLEETDMERERPGGFLSPLPILPTLATSWSEGLVTFVPLPLAPSPVCTSTAYVARTIAIRSGNHRPSGSLVLVGPPAGSLGFFASSHPFGWSEARGQGGHSQGRCHTSLLTT